MRRCLGLNVFCWLSVGALIAGSGCTAAGSDDESDENRGRADSGADVADDAGQADGGELPREPLDALEGDADELASEAIPRMDFLFDPDDYDADTGKSFNTLLLTMDADATVSDVNELLEDEDAVIVGGYPGMPGETFGLVALKLPTTTPSEMAEALERLKERSGVTHAAEDGLMEGDVIPGEDPDLPNWRWTGTTGGGNWGLKLSNVPGMWNWNETIEQDEPAIPVGVIDVGYFEHVDVDFSWDGARDTHGTHVAGIIGATFDNGIGTDGVNPFAKLTPTDGRSGGNVALTVLPDLLDSQTVISMSMGTPWYKYEDKPEQYIDSPEQRDWVNETGAMTFEVLRTAEARNGSLPHVVVSAGNDSSAARYNSGLANASIEWGAKNVIVVENLAYSASSPGQATLSTMWGSSLSGTLAAPGTQILSAVDNDGYDLLSGTSMATPLVSGLISYLYAMEPDLPRPTLAQNDVLDLLLDNSIETGGNASNRPDAFRTAFDVDRLMGKTDHLRALVDIDDGSIDGNRRVDPISGAEDTNLDHDGNGRLGDGSVDMSDFRVLRDAIEYDKGHRSNLDGSATNPKHDLNGDGKVLPSDTGDVIFMRMDFNGDGTLLQDQKVALGGAVNAEANDIDVLKVLFEDELYEAEELLSLTESADFTVDLGKCFENEDVNEVTIAFLYDEGEAYKAVTRFRSQDENLLVLTVPTLEWDVQLRAVDEAGDDVDVLNEVFTFATIGQDIGWEPSCETTLEGFAFSDLSPDTADNGEVVRVRLDALPNAEIVDTASVRFESEDGSLLRDAEIRYARVVEDGANIAAELDVVVPIIQAAAEWLVFVELEGTSGEPLEPDGNGKALHHRRQFVGRWNMNVQPEGSTECDDPNPSTDWYFWSDGTWTDIGTDAQLDRATWGTQTAGIIDGTWSSEGNEIFAQSCENETGYSFEFQGTYDPATQTLDGIYTVNEEGTDPFVALFCSQSYTKPNFGCNDVVCQTDRIPFSRQSCIGDTCVSGEDLVCLAPNGTRQCLETAANLDQVPSCNIGDRCTPGTASCCACIDDPDLSDDGVWICAEPLSNLDGCPGLPVPEGTPCDDDAPATCHFCTPDGTPTVQRCSGGEWINR